MPIEDIETGHQISDEDAQVLIRRTFERTGKFIMHAPVEPILGEVQMYAGLPLRFVRFVTYEEAVADHAMTTDIWGCQHRDVCINPDEYHFEVEVAD
jgi:hypothetical protein